MLQGPLISSKKKKRKTNVKSCGHCRSNIRKGFLSKLQNPKAWKKESLLRCPECGCLYEYADNKFIRVSLESLFSSKMPWPYNLPPREQPEFKNEG